MRKPTVTKATVATAIINGADGAEAIAKAIGYGGKTGKVSKSTLEKITAILDQPATLQSDEPITVNIVNKINKSGNPFAFGLKHDLFKIASNKEQSMDDAVTHGVSLTGRPAATVKTFLTVMGNPNDHFNQRRTTNIAKTNGNVLLARV